jgi:hypothetical protein
MAGAWGKPGRKPTFNDWYHMHRGDGDMMRQSTPTDVKEYLGLDPWTSDPHVERLRDQLMAARRAIDGTSEEVTHGAVVPAIGECE